MMTIPKRPVALLTGATGYIGGRLLPRLFEAGYVVRCLVRDASRLPRSVVKQVEVVAGDAADGETLARALSGVDVAWYLLHGMGDDGDWRSADRRMAEGFGASAKAAGVGRIVYLGGLGSGPELSPHLASRQEVGRVLRESGVPTVELRASIVIGPGSLSFELVRDLVERLPVMVTPRWVRVEAQPIAVDDVLAYLVGAAALPLSGSRVFEIGGPEAVSYAGLMREYARQRGLRRWMLPVPVLTPWLSGLWLGLVTPVRAAVGRELLEGVRNPTVVTDDAARSAFAVRPVSIAEAIRRALAGTEAAVSAAGGAGAIPAGWLGDVRELRVAAPPDRAFEPISRIGGATGWYFGDALWRLRGWLDRAVGGPGFRRGRPGAEDLKPGDPVDFWRVDTYEPGRRLRLEAEMKVPGRAWLSFDVAPTEDGSVIRQMALFHPRGLPGHLYWWALRPVHEVVFRGMLRGIARAIPSDGPPSMR
jgi:uncharacterized protein YbjT (DUF2867 family)